MSLAINLKTETGILERTENVTRYFDDVKKYPILKKEEEEKWFKLLRNGTESEKKKARDYIWLCNQRLVIASAKKWATAENLTDYINEANIGLADAIDRFDVSKGVKFCTYAVWFIKRAINRYNNEIVPMVHKTNHSKTYHVISKATNEFVQNNERTPTTEELKELINKSYNKNLKDKNDLLDVQISRMDELTAKKDSRETVSDVILDYNRISSTTNKYNEEEDDEYNKSLVNSLLRGLKPREQELIKMRFGMIEYNGMKRELEVAEIAKELSLTPERVRQMEDTIIKKLKRIYGDNISKLI